MKVLGLILELNPPHNGHKYFIDKARKLTNADIVIALVTTSFSMRGDVSVMDKFVKAKTALEMGVDFVFEYPIALAMQSADYFANNAIYILNNLGISDIAFGVENDDLSVLNYAKEIYKSDRFNLLLKEYLDKGYSYTLASHIALKEFGVDESIANDLSKPNNTLALAYLKALEKYPNINITLIKRIENEYYDETLNKNSISSASAIRKAISNNIDVTCEVINKDYIYVDEKKGKDNLYMLLKYVYSSNDPSRLKMIKGIKEGLEVRIANFLNKESFESFIESVKTKRYSINYINRVILNTVLGIDENYQECDYYRLLAFKKSAQKYLSKINKRDLFFSSFKDMDDEIVNIEAKASKVYDLITGKSTFEMEYKVPLKKED